MKLMIDLSLLYIYFIVTRSKKKKKRITGLWRVCQFKFLMALNIVGDRLKPRNTFFLVLSKTRTHTHPKEI